MLRATVALVVLGLGLSLVAAQPPAPAPAVTMDDIKKAWQERQDKVKTLKMSWTQRVTHPKGSLTDALSAAVGKKFTEPQPPRDLLLEGTCQFHLTDDGKYSLETKCESWSHLKQAPRPYHTRLFFDGRHHFSEQLPTEPGSNPTLVASKPKQVSGELRTIGTYPIFWLFRGVDESFTERMLDQFEITGRYVTRLGRACLELVETSRIEGQTRSLYLDRGRGWLPVSLVVRTGAAPTLQLDIEYQPEPVTGWYPASWSYSANRPNGQLRESVRFAVTECRINDAVAAPAFVPALAPGTHLIDFREGDEGTQTVVKEDGSLGRTLPLRSQLTYDEVKAESAKPDAVWRAVAIWACVAALVVSVGVACLLRWKRRTPSSPA